MYEEDEMTVKMMRKTSDNAEQIIIWKVGLYWSFCSRVHALFLYEIIFYGLFSFLAIFLVNYQNLCIGCFCEVESLKKRVDKII